MNLEEQRKKADFSRRFKQFLEEWKKEENKTQNDFCIAAGVSKNTVTNWKKGSGYPRDARIMKISEVFHKDPRALNPFFQLDKNAVDNSVCNEWSQSLQVYADEKGLDESFYQYFISKPQFIRDFPFSQKSYLPNIGFAPVKYQFMDDTGRMIMMQKADIDFLIKLQNQTDSAIDYLMYRKRRKRSKEDVANKVDIWIKPYKGIERSEVLSRLYIFDLTKADQSITDKEIFEAIEQIAKEKGIQPKYNKTEIIEEMTANDPIHTDEWKRTWREWGRLNSQEEKAEQIIQDAENKNKLMIAKHIERLRMNGLLAEEKED